jgi:type IV fimbrial biogenesis protein FimT
MVAPMTSTVHTKNRSVRPNPQAVSGFTLIEALTVMTIAAVLMSIGIPSFRYVTTANRMSSDVNGLLGDLQYARAEAIKRGQTVTVCPTAVGGTNCANVSTWQNGWLVISDTGTIGTIDGNDVILRVQKAFTNSEDFQADRGTYITFNREGFVQTATLPVTLTLHDATANTQYTRCLSFTIVGAMATQTAGHQTAGGVACGP